MKISFLFQTATHCTKMVHDLQKTSLFTTYIFHLKHFSIWCACNKTKEGKQFYGSTQYDICSMISFTTTELHL